MYERRHEPILPRRRFAWRLLGHAAFAALVIVGSLVLGVLGYHRFEGMRWLDALLNAAMILGGMGQIDPPRTDAGKLFAAFYALYGGLVFIVVMSLMLAPVTHRLLHHLHFEERRSGKD